MTEINITPFDNEISILYKWARRFKIPARLIIVNTVIEGEKQRNIYANGIELVQTIMADKTEKTLEQIANTINKLETEDIAMIYLLISLNQNKGVTELISEINRLYEQNKLQTIQDEQELRLLLTNWRNNLAIELQNDMENLQNLETIHTELAKYPEIAYSPIKVEQVTLKAVPTLINGTIPTVDDSITIFNESKLSYDVPYIKYNNLSKLYRGRTDEEMPNYKMVIPHASQISDLNHFYLTIWNGKGQLEKATKESYMKGSYNLSENLLTIKTPTEDNSRDNIIKNIERALPINITNITETAISGEFFLFDLDVNDIYLVDMVINTELMNSYLFVKETNTPYAEKKQLKIYYKSFSGFVEEEEKVAEGYIVNPSSVTVSLTQNKAHGGEIVLVQTPEGEKKFRLPNGLPYVRAKITQAESLDTANQFVKIFSRLMRYYKAEKDNVERLYSAFVPELTQATTREIKITVKQATGKKGAGDSKIERLKEVAPDLFVNGYARKCQCSMQPIAIPPDEIQAWQNHTFLYKETQKQRQVMPFPPDNPQWYFVCPSDSTPYPGVKLNEVLPNKDIYPCLPCCFKDDQMDPQANSKYNECYSGKIKKEKPTGGIKESTKETHKIKTDRILGTGRYGYLPKGVADLLSKYQTDKTPDKTIDKKIDMVRMGIPQSTNSLLHCVSIAIQDPSYAPLTGDQKEEYVTNIRNIIAKQAVPNLMKQEMFDFSDEEISEQLSNNEIFLDPNLFYRAIEQLYNINIYVFAPPEKDDSSSLGSFEIPRFKLFHSRAPRPEKRAVLIFRTRGAESDSLLYPQCELIIDRDETNNKNIYSFGSEMNNLLHDALVTLNRTITWELTNDVPQRIVARENIYSRENYFYLLNRAPTRQIIDGYGKVQAFIFPVTVENQTVDMTVIIPSTQPENLPTGEITRVDVAVAVSVFGEPNSVSKVNNLVDGLWYQVLDLEHGIYIPVHLSNVYLDKPVGPNNPLLEEGIEVVKRLRKIKRDLETIIQIIIWLFLLSNLTINEFANKYMSIGHDPVTDSSLVYDFSKVSMKFPIVRNTEEGIEQIKLVAPTLFTENRIFLYSQKFFEGIIYHLEKYNTERKPRQERNQVKIPTVIHRTDISEEDFTPQRRVAIFTSDNDMKTWLNSLDKLSFKNILVEDELSISNALRTEPYLYSSPTGSIYLIQNVAGGDRMRAINVAYNWYLNKINSGHRTEPFDNENIPVFVVYGISPALAPVIIENHAGTSTEYLQILSYGSGQHAAMLSLL